MGKKHSEAKIRFWADIPPEVRSERLSKAAYKMWENKSTEERQARAMLMVKAKQEKKKRKLSTG